MGQTAALKDDVDDGVDIGDVHLAVTVHVGKAFIGVDLPMDDTDDAIHISDVHLAIGIHVTSQYIDFPGEIARVAWAAVDAGTGGIHMVHIVNCSLATDKLGAAKKHFLGFSHSICTPAIAGIYRFQILAAIEHGLHVPHIRRIEATQVKGCQSIASGKHASHVSHIRGVEVTHVECRQRFTALEHVLHFCCARGVHATQGQISQGFTAREYISHVLHIQGIEAT